MAYNPSPKVREARKYAKKFGFDKVIIVGLDEAEGIIIGTSYGTTKTKCDEAKSLMNTAFNAVQNEYNKS